MISNSYDNITKNDSFIYLNRKKKSRCFNRIAENLIKDTYINITWNRFNNQDSTIVMIGKNTSISVAITTWDVTKSCAKIFSIKSN